MKAIVKLLIICCLSGTLFSCSRGDDYPLKYTRQEFVGGEIKMFTSYGEVTDEQIINGFISRIRAFHTGGPGFGEDPYSFDDDVEIFDDFNIEIVFFSDEKGKVTDMSGSGAGTTPVEFIVRKSGDDINLSLRDTLSSYWYGENPVYSMNPEIVSRVDIPMMGELVSYLRPLYARKQNKEIHVWVVSYMYSSKMSGDIVLLSIIAAANNKISSDYLAGLTKPGRSTIDTIVYKQSHIVFSR